MSDLILLFLENTRDSIYMTVVSTLIAYVIGLPLGILLVVTAADGIRPQLVLNKVLGALVNLLRSFPFLILLFVISPFTRLVVGTTLGPNATIVALVVAAAPFIARMVESSLREVDGNVIEAAQSMGSSSLQIILKVMLPESRSSLILNAAIALTTILGYSAMAGIVGGGGLGDLAIRYGYYRYQYNIMYIAVFLLVLIVEVMQGIGLMLAKKLDKRL
ncbi:MAG: ABC transporter permease [Oscillospiraceae bacterium]|nr:ABC transporter permease [Oscillospiraceae bacterium]MDD4369421.1 ABC transporter permease [Oscillospiraceae bacterium]